jgi:hypothetical protein
VVVTVLLAAGAVLAQEPPVPPAPTLEKVWEEIRGRPNPKVGDGFELLEDFPLVPAAKGLPPHMSALGAIVCYALENRVVTEKEVIMPFFTFTNALYEEMTRIRGVPPEEDQKWDDAVDEALEDFLAAKLARVRKRLKQAHDDAYDTGKGGLNDEVVAAFLLKAYTGRGSLADGVRAYGRDMLMDVTVQEEKEASWDGIKEAIDKKLPVLLSSKDRVCVAVGYYSRAGFRGVLAYEPTAAAFRVRTGADLSPERPREGMDEGWKKAVEWRMKQVHHDVWTIENQLELKESGLTLLPIENGKLKLAATYISDWRADVKRLMPEIERDVLSRFGAKLKRRRRDDDDGEYEDEE